jgi:hypothetical protein
LNVHRIAQFVFAVCFDHFSENGYFVIMPPFVLATDDESLGSSTRSLVESQEEVVAPLSTTERSVTFQDNYIILHEYDKVGQELRDELWYPQDVLKLIMLRNSLTRNLIQVGRFQESEEQTIRGLEREDREHKHDTWKAVRGEQHRQTEKGVRSPAGIAKFSRAASHNNRMKARATGLRDAAVACGIEPPQQHEKKPATVIEVARGKKQPQHEGEQAIVNEVQSKHREEKPATVLEVAGGKKQPQHEGGQAIVIEVQSTDILGDSADTPVQRKGRKGGLMKVMEKYARKDTKAHI